VKNKNLEQILAVLKKSAPITGRIFKKIPKFVWIGFALLGIFVAGTMLGFEASEDTHWDSFTKRDALQYENEKYQALITGYEDMSKLYWGQGEAMVAILNDDNIMNNPQKIADSMKTINQARDLIILQQGRIMELRKAAGYDAPSQTH